MPQKADQHSPEFNDGQRLYTMKQVLLRSATREYREKWFLNAYVTEAKRQLEHEHEHDDDDDNSPRSVETFALTRKLMPERDRIAEMIPVAEDLKREEGQASLRDISSLCIDDNRVAYRPIEHPVNENVLDVHKRS
jgi:hypothetical protein